jgi:hypothetical protein
MPAADNTWPKDAHTLLEQETLRRVKLEVGSSQPVEYFSQSFSLSLEIAREHDKIV